MKGYHHISSDILLTNYCNKEKSYVTFQSGQHTMLQAYFKMDTELSFPGFPQQIYVQSIVHVHMQVQRPNSLTRAAHI